MDVSNGRYRVLRKIGAGGSGEVYEAIDCALSRRVALKRLHTSLSPALLESEARALARISHPDIVAIHDIILDEGRVWLVMEYVHGSNLHQWLETYGPMSPESAIAVFQRIARAVHHAHMHGVLHCDLKPANILLSTSGDLKLTDFTLARVLESGSFRGTDGGSTPYAAPEQIDGGAVDARADVFALGVLLSHLAGCDRMGATHQPALAEIVERATRADPAERYASVGAMLERLPTTYGGATHIVPAAIGGRQTDVLPRTALHRQVTPDRPRSRVPLLSAVAVAGSGLVAAVHVSASPAVTTVPNVVGVARGPATQILHSLGLRVHSIRTYSATVPAGSVIEQRPASQDTVRPGSTITVVISQGPRPVQIPSLAGLSGDQAVQKLRQLGLRVQVQTDETITQSADEVEGQSPGAGTYRVPGSTVTITVSAHPWWWPFS